MFKKDAEEKWKKEVMELVNKKCVKNERFDEVEVCFCLLSKPVCHLPVMAALPSGAVGRAAASRAGRHRQMQPRQMQLEDGAHANGSQRLLASLPGASCGGAASPPFSLRCGRRRCRQHWRRQRARRRRRCMAGRRPWRRSTRQRWVAGAAGSRLHMLHCTASAAPLPSTRLHSAVRRTGTGAAVAALPVPAPFCRRTALSLRSPPCCLIRALTGREAGGPGAR